MSQWTHVCGVVRYDAFRFFGIDCKPDLGIACDFDDMDRSEKCTVPCGSEGSLSYHLIESPDPHSLSAYTVVVWGDLRDYDDEAEIVAYFNRICTDKRVPVGFCIRQACFEVEVEGRERKVYNYDDEKKTFVCRTPERWEGKETIDDHK